MEESQFEASNSRHIYVMPQTSDQRTIMAIAKDSSKLLQPVSILGGSSQSGDISSADMWLWCPPINRKKAKPYIKKIDHFSSINQNWVKMAHEIRKIYRCSTASLYIHFCDYIFTVKLFCNLDYVMSLLTRTTIMGGRWAIQAYWVSHQTIWQR